MNFIYQNIFYEGKKRFLLILVSKIVM